MRTMPINTLAANSHNFMIASHALSSTVCSYASINLFQSTGSQTGDREEVAEFLFGIDESLTNAPIAMSFRNK